MEWVGLLAPHGLLSRSLIQFLQCLIVLNSHLLLVVFPLAQQLMAPKIRFNLVLAILIIDALVEALTIALTEATIEEAIYISYFSMFKILE